MNFTEENIKYCLLSFDKPTKDHIDHYKNQDLCITGLYQWSNIFNGNIDFPLWPEDMDKYNLIHVNITPRNLPLIPKLLKMVDRNKTKLLFNADHAMDMWNNAFNYPTYFLDTMNKADYVFAVEPYMAELLTNALKRNVPCIPHPCDVKNLIDISKKSRENKIGVSLHRYDNNSILPYYALNELPGKFATSLIGGGRPDFSPKLHHVYPEIQPHLKFKELMEFISNLLIMVETYAIKSYGRLTVECAALAVPVVGSGCVYAQKKCFPSLTTDNTFNPIEIKPLVHKLLSDPAFWSEKAKEGIKNAAYFSLDKSKKRMLNFLNSGDN